MTKTIHASQALTPDGWAQDVRITIGGDRIESVTAGTPPAPGDTRSRTIVPGMPNLHSHAFQRGFAGLAERRGPTDDSFWTWREAMYRFALTMNPDHALAVARLAYVEMLEAGFTRVGEFHYLHHAPDGRPYDDIAEMSAQIASAAEETGIALTHLPVFYAHGNFGGADPGPGQRRFLNSLDSFAVLVEGCAALITRPHDRLGIAPHSLRAVTEEELGALVAAHPAGPVHIHVAEQMREVADCLAHCGQRPVERLMALQDIGPRWCLIHATHMTPGETGALAQSGAVAGLCPITEANLGDGIFPAAGYKAAGGAFGIGTDSNVQISVAGELRHLEYGQRLARQARNILANADGSTGAALFSRALAGGARALDAEPPAIAPGSPADLVALADPLTLPPGGDRELDRWIFATGLAVSDVWAAGRHVVRAGRHIGREHAAAEFARAMRELLA